MLRFERCATVRNAADIPAAVQFATEVTAYLNKRHSLNMNFDVELFGQPCLHWYSDDESLDRMSPGERGHTEGLRLSWHARQSEEPLAGREPEGHDRGCPGHGSRAAVSSAPVVRAITGFVLQHMRVSKVILPLAFALSAAPMPTHAIEEPAYEVTARIGDVELRQYAPYVVAEVLIAGSATEAGNRGFQILASYIFGKNKGEKKLAMTAPVTQTAAPMKLEMTAPVIQSAAPGGYRVQFVLPRGVTLDTAPEPIDQRVMLRQVQPMHVAVIRYSGFWSDANYNRHLAQLEDTLRKAGVKWSGEPIYSRYNPPFTPWFLRRNEIWLQLPGDAGKSANRSH